MSSIPPLGVTRQSRSTRYVESHGFGTFLLRHKSRLPRPVIPTRSLIDLSSSVPWTFFLGNKLFIGFRDPTFPFHTVHVHLEIHFSVDSEDQNTQTHMGSLSRTTVVHPVPSRHIHDSPSAWRRRLKWRFPCHVDQGGRESTLRGSVPGPGAGGRRRGRRKGCRKSYQTQVHLETKVRHEAPVTVVIGAEDT